MVVPAVSAALIVRNEEQFLEGCLRSLVDHVDEVVIVDTGSTDPSIEIAEHHGAKLHRFAWTGDFSAARNHGLDRCSGGWILYIDADERLVVSVALPSARYHSTRCPGSVRPCSSGPSPVIRATWNPACSGVIRGFDFVGRIHETCHAEMRTDRRGGRAFQSATARHSSITWDMMATRVASIRATSHF